MCGNIWQCVGTYSKPTGIYPLFIWNDKIFIHKIMNSVRKDHIIFTTSSYHQKEIWTTKYKNKTTTMNIPKTIMNTPHIEIKSA